MIIEGVKLTCLGMGVVYLFLGLLVVVIHLTSRLLRPFTAREEAIYLAAPEKKKVPQRRPDDQQQRLLAVISAAIAAHRAKSGLPAAILPQSAAQRIAIAPPPGGGGDSQGTQGITGRRPSLARLLFRDLTLYRGYGQHPRPQGRV